MNKTVLAVLAFTPMLHQALAAQQRCEGPGASFGVTSYTCSSCGIKTELGKPTVFVFNSEPMVSSTTTTSLLRPGDVVLSVAGKPITTSAGSEVFSYPPSGVTVLRVRRGSTDVNLEVPITESCQPKLTAENRVVQGKELRAEVVPGRTGSPAESDSRFGFAISCLPSCTRVTASDGSDYWKFDDHPPIAALRQRGPAEGAGLQLGDRITAIDGISILTEEGALRFLHASKRESMHLTVLREGKTIRYFMRAK